MLRLTVFSFRRVSPINSFLIGKGDHMCVIIIHMLVGLENKFDSL